MHSDRAHARVVTDLLWAINSTSLIDSSDQTVASLPVAYADQIDSGHLINFLESSPTKRVGRYFEQLVAFYLEQVMQVEVVANQQNVVVDGRTVGEVDFLYRDHGGVLTHLEVAVKFYLCLGDTAKNGSHFVGPNAADTFERKFQKLFDHQLPLSKVYFPKVARREVLMKGRIYYHPKASDPELYPPRLAGNHHRGTWVRSSEMADLKDLKFTKWQVLSKPHWLTIDPQSDSMTFDQLDRHAKSHFATANFPLHCAALANGRERLRIFIVNDDWPNAVDR